MLRLDGSDCLQCENPQMMTWYKEESDGLVEFGWNKGKCPSEGQAMLNETEERSGDRQRVVATWFTQMPNLARSSFKHRQTLLQSQLIIIYKILYLNKHSYICKILLQIKRVNNYFIILKKRDLSKKGI